MVIAAVVATVSAVAIAAAAVVVGMNIALAQLDTRPEDDHNLSGWELVRIVAAGDVEGFEPQKIDEQEIAAEAVAAEAGPGPTALVAVLQGRSLVEPPFPAVPLKDGFATHEERSYFQ